MIYLKLFWVFFEIGLFTIGGGQAMIPLIMKEVVANNWLTQEQLINFIGIAESTPGPFAINIATYTGVEVAGIWGAISTTVGVVLPSLIIIILIVKLFSSLMKKPLVQEVFVGVRASVTGLLLSVLISLFLIFIFGITSIYDTSTLDVDFIGIGLFALILPFSFIKIKGKRIKPIFIILFSALVGTLAYGFIPIG